MTAVQEPLWWEPCWDAPPCDGQSAPARQPRARREIGTRDPQTLGRRRVHTINVPGRWL